MNTKQAQPKTAAQIREAIRPMTASEMGKLGAQARIAKTTSDQRKAWARKAGKASGKARLKNLKEKSNVATSQETNLSAQPYEKSIPN